MPNMRFPFDALSAARPRRRPPSASHKDARLDFRNVVGAGRKQFRIDLDHMRERQVKKAAVVTLGKQTRIACFGQRADCVCIRGLSGSNMVAVNRHARRYSKERAALMESPFDRRRNARRVLRPSRQACPPSLHSDRARDSRDHDDRIGQGDRSDREIDSGRLERITHLAENDIIGRGGIGEDTAASDGIVIGA